MTTAVRPVIIRLDEGGDAFVGTRTLIRFMLRRDRVRIAGWATGIAAYWLYCTRLVPVAYETDADLEGAGQLLAGPAGRMFTGPAFGFDDLDHERLIVGGYALYLVGLAALMSLLGVVRHTRVEEQTGRAELVRANVVGRHAQLTAALTVAAITNVIAAVAVYAVMATADVFDVGGSLLVAASVAAGGLAFAGLAAVTIQVTEHSRAAAGLAGAGLGAAFVLRGIGDMAAVGGNFLSWLSPLAWSQQTAPFVLGRWWPLALSLGFAVACAVTGYVLSARRDVGASLFSVRPGPAHAAAWIRSPLTFALRLQRVSIIGWAASLAVAGATFGAFADAMLVSIDDLPDTVAEVLGGTDDIVGGYLSTMGLFMALAVGVYAILSVQALHSEETTGRVEPVLATATSRPAWLGSHLAITSVAAVVALAAAGVATGLGAAAVTGEATLIWDSTAAHIVHAPAVWFVLGIAAFLYGAAPWFLGATWALLGYGLFAGMYGPLMNLPAWAYNLSPFEHTARIPLETMDVVPLAVLTALAAGVVGLGLGAFRRRDIDTR